MAWQSLSSMGGGSQNNGGGSVGDGGNRSNQPQGTEYTLQGMRPVVVLPRTKLTSV